MTVIIEICGTYYNLAHVGHLYRTNKTIYVASPNWDRTVTHVMESEEEAENKLKEIEQLR